MKMSSIIPILRSFDEAKAREFYVDFLGFQVDWEHRFGDNFPLYMQISQGDVYIHLTEHHGDGSPGSALRINMVELEAYRQSLLAKQYKNSKPGCEKTEWGTLEMTITDPFGNRITFSESLDSVES